MEDSLRRQDHVYGMDVPRKTPVTNTNQEAQDDGTDSKYEMSNAHSGSVSSELPSDDQSDGSELEADEKSSKAKSHTKKAKKVKVRLLREEVAANRKTVGSAGTVARKCKNENGLDANEQAPKPKRAKPTQSASNLNPDWCKTVGLLAKESANGILLGADEEGDTTLIPRMEKSRSSSRASSCSGSHSMPETSSDFVVGEFDVDEPEEMIAAAREHKSAKVKDTKGNARSAGKYCTTAAMGLKINKKAADDAVKEEEKAVKKLKLQKPLWKLKLEDVPLQDKGDRTIWTRLIAATIDWAGTITDPFGTNEHPELGPRLQELWDIFFQHNEPDINEHPAIKKIISLLATDRLNEWRSTFGKDALKILKHQFRRPEFRHDIDAHIKFVRDLLPHKVNNQKCVPFVFADIKNFKGAWLSPVLLELAATHVRQCGKAFGAFGKPIGALGLAAAVVHLIHLITMFSYQY
ncbi:hypothetical protein BDR03DRAFT_1016058 [Suillus americanus]|nr:hypothetical protein BDR03DRAFT_1016058 [Suillus americanus]